VTESEPVAGRRPADQAARAHGRAGSARRPILTIGVLVPTAAVSIAGLITSPVREALERSPAALADGQFWRLLTALLVQDGGPLGTAVNLAGLAVLGVLVERRIGRGRWLAGYLGAGLVGELVGWAGWQHTGAGNSVAVCGLAGVLAVDLAADPSGARGTRVGSLAVALWSAAVLGGAFGSPVLTVVACAVVAAAVNLAALRPTALTPGRTAAGVAAACALVLLLRADIHGAALAAGLLVGIVRLRGRDHG
jgi:membrane associated rhomboid family serine protease